METGNQSKPSEDRKPSVNSVAYVDNRGYAGTPTSFIAPVFELACRLRFTEPNAERIIRQTKTPLDQAIVSALIDAAIRLLPPDNTPNGVKARLEKGKRRAERAERAEEAFLANFNRRGYPFLSEVQQKELMTITPDIRFAEPTLICGHLCWWLEYKDFFGFRANPFVAARNRKQFRKYAAQIGPGAVVYNLGFEIDHVKIEGVKIFREEDVIKSLTSPSGNGVKSSGYAEASGVDETRLSRLDHRAQGRIDGERPSQKKTKRHKSKPNRSPHTIITASIEIRNLRVTKGYQTKGKHKSRRYSSKDNNNG
jgi:hypothetical protein